MTTPEDVAYALADILEYGTAPDMTDLGEVVCRTFRESNMTVEGAYDGIIITLPDGAEFSVRINQTAPGANNAEVER